LARWQDFLKNGSTTQLMADESFYLNFFDSSPRQITPSAFQYGER
jgi:hypothetical protein